MLLRLDNQAWSLQEEQQRERLQSKLSAQETTNLSVGLGVGELGEFAGDQATQTVTVQAIEDLSGHEEAFQLWGMLWTSLEGFELYVL